jgi:hypothetical protein
MKDIIELLQKERIKTVDALKHGNQQELSYLQQIDKALGWLKRIEEKGLEDVGCYDIHSLPDLPQENSGLYSFYHIMMDYESPNIEDWKEYRPNGQSLLLSFDDIVMTRKSSFCGRLFGRSPSGRAFRCKSSLCCGLSPAIPNVGERDFTVLRLNLGARAVPSRRLFPTIP